MSLDKKRRELKKAGWKREDRTHDNIHFEYWVPPWDGIGFRPLAMSLNRALAEYDRRRSNGKRNLEEL